MQMARTRTMPVYPSWRTASTTDAEAIMGAIETAARRHGETVLGVKKATPSATNTPATTAPTAACVPAAATRGMSAAATASTDGPPASPEGAGSAERSAFLAEAAPDGHRR